MENKNFGKKGNFKRVALAVALAAGFSVAGIAVTAQATEARLVKNPCTGEHSWFVYDSSECYYEELSHFNHRKYVKNKMVCGNCGMEDYEWEITYEDHTLVNAPYVSGHTYECLYCEYYE